MITVSIQGADGLKRELGSILPKSEAALLQLAERIYDIAREGADRHTKPPTPGQTRRPGALLDSLGHGPKRIPDGWEIGHDLQRAPHAVFVHWGTRPHDIKPKNKKALRWASGNGFVFSKFVHHPGYKGDPYLINAADQAIREFPAMVAQKMKG